MPKIRKVPDGAADLRSYLKKIDQTVPEFCEAHGLDRIQVQRVLKGERTRISVDFADAIERATNGDVYWRAWLLRTATRVIETAA